LSINVGSSYCAADASRKSAQMSCNKYQTNCVQSSAQKAKSNDSAKHTSSSTKLHR
jgi:hypothetical protein